MTHHYLVLTLGAMSVVVAAEAFWLNDKIIAEKRLRLLTQQPSLTVLKAIYFLAFPYIGLIGGLIPERLFGLKGLEYFARLGSFPTTPADFLIRIGYALQTWLPDFGSVALLGALAGILWGVYLWFYTGFASKTGLLIPLPHESKTEICFDIVHWSFYRAVLWLVTDDLYLGVIGGSTVMLVEYIAISRLGNFSNEVRHRYLLKFGLGMLTSFIFLFAPNLWLIAILHLVLATTGNVALKNRRNSAVSQSG